MIEPAHSTQDGPEAGPAVIWRSGGLLLGFSCLLVPSRLECMAALAHVVGVQRLGWSGARELARAFLQRDVIPCKFVPWCETFATAVSPLAAPGCRDGSPDPARSEQHGGYMQDRSSASVHWCHHKCSSALRLDLATVGPPSSGLNPGKSDCSTGAH